jgi:hypothetical protein
MQANTGRAFARSVTALDGAGHDNGGVQGDHQTGKAGNDECRESEHARVHGRFGEGLVLVPGGDPGIHAEINMMPSGVGWRKRPRSIYATVAQPATGHFVRTRVRRGSRTLIA